jgi:glycolate oxidase FAD binding subunit
VSVIGTGSKSFLLPDSAHRPAALLSVSEHQGVVDYRPDELVVTVRSGTALQALEQTLTRNGQMLPFEPPEFRGSGTIGGAVAAGLSGPGRPWRGSVRDAVLGVKLVNGIGDLLDFGGRVVKNVAGYDVSRLQCGAFGTLGVLLEVSLRVVPRPALERTLTLELGAAEAIATMRAWSQLPLPLSGMCHVDGTLHVRLSGSESAVLTAAGRLGGERGDNAFWQRLRDQELDFFRRDGVLLVQHPAPALPPPEGWQGLIDWAGGRRWHYPAPGERTARGALEFGTGYARGVCQALAVAPPVGEYQRRLRVAFDPDGLFNPELGDADVAA